MKENDAKSIERRKTTEGKKAVQAIYHRWYRHIPAMTMWHSAKNRARKKEILFTITPDDIVVPTHCPVLGIPIFIGEKGRRDNSPSLDRIRPERGYVKDNIAIISMRANRIKNDATLEEITRLQWWMTEQLRKTLKEGI